MIELSTEAASCVGAARTFLRLLPTLAVRLSNEALGLDPDVVQPDVPPEDSRARAMKRLADWLNPYVRESLDRYDLGLEYQNVAPLTLESVAKVPLAAIDPSAMDEWLVGTAILRKLLDPKAIAGLEEGDYNVMSALDEICAKLERLLPEPRLEPSPGDFDFLGNKTFENVLRRDAAEMRESFSRGSWKCVLVMCGSLVEATLVCAIGDACGVASTERSGWLPPAEDVSSAGKTRVPSLSTGAPLDDQRLEALIGLAEAHKLVDRELAARLNALRNWRNLLHPGLAVRKDVPSRAHALGAVADVELLQEQLRRNLPAIRERRGRI